MSASSLVRLRIVFYTIWALGTCWGVSMAGVKWASMGWEEQSCLIVGIVVNWTGMMIAFFDKSVWRAEEERKANGNTVDRTTKPPEVPSP